MTERELICILFVSAASCTDTEAPPASVWQKPADLACPTNCGPDANADCCASSLVPGAHLLPQTTTSEAMISTRHDPSRDAVSDFRLDKYEVSVGRFRQFVEAGGGTAANAPPLGAGGDPNIPGTGWAYSWLGGLQDDSSTWNASLMCGPSATWTPDEGPHEQLPLNCVSWFAAAAFCTLDGGFLPTAAEWGYAAAGGAEQRVYPWSIPASSMAIDCSDTSLFDNTKECSVTVGVGSDPLGDAKWGQSDMGGNMSEWVFDVDAIDLSGTTAHEIYIDPCDNCARLVPDPQDPTNTSRCIRGGADKISPLGRTANILGSGASLFVWSTGCSM